MKNLSGSTKEVYLNRSRPESQEFSKKLGMNIWIQRSRRKLVLRAWLTGKMSSQSLREKMVECTCRSVWVGLYWFHTCIFPEDVKRLEFWVWAGMKGVRAEKWNSQVSNTLVCVQQPTHTFRLLREITGNYLCVHGLKMGLCEKPEVHSQLVIVAGSWRAVLKR